MILAHTDPKHIQRLARRLSSFSDVFIHIDSSVDIELFKEGLNDLNVYFLEKRFHCEWGGGGNAVEAEIALLEFAQKNKRYERFVFLQGADYPIKSNQYIQQFYEKNINVEYIRACNCTLSDDPYFYEKCRYYLYPNHRNLIKKVHDKVIRYFRICLKNGKIYDGKMTYDVFWGTAQWSITGDFAEYVVAFFRNNPEFNRWFLHSFPADELYFCTVIMNSEFRERTLSGGPEPARRGLANWRNLHYFEYSDSVRIFTDSDYQLLKNCKELYARKVNTEKSKKLLDMLDDG